MDRTEIQFVSFYKKDESLIRQLSAEQTGKLLFAMFDCVFHDKDTDFSQDPLLKSVYDTVVASALKLAKRYNDKVKRSKLESNKAD